MIDGFLGEFADKMLAFSELEDEDALRELQAGFNRQTKTLLWVASVTLPCPPWYTNWVIVIGAVDGMAVRIKGPAGTECSNPRTYYNRKGFFSVNLQAMCDVRRRFRWASVMCAGSAHDATAWGASGMSEAASILQRLGLWIAGDDAYPLSEWLIMPFPGKGIPAYQCNVNFYQSRLRCPGCTLDLVRGERCSK